MHPLVKENDYTHNFVPNDCVMMPDKGRFITITGPNMGGKSTYIRQVAIAALLSQVGMFVPAARAEVRIHRHPYLLILFLYVTGALISYKCVINALSRSSQYSRR